MADKPKKNGKDKPSVPRLRRDEPSKPDLPDESGWELTDKEDSGVSERPTVAPPFDLESYAKESSSDDLMRAAAVPRHPPPRLRRPSLEDRVNEALEEERVRAPSDTAITMPPPPDDAAEVPPLPRAGIPRVPAPQSSSQPQPASQPASTPMSQRQTPREMKRVEEARARLLAEEALKQPASRPQTLLSLANMMAPSLPPVKPEPAAPPSDGVVEIVEVIDAGEPEPTRVGAGEPTTEMRERFALGDYSGALVIAESMLEENPTHVEAREYADSCRSVLQQMYTARIGPLDRVPIVEVARDQLRWLSIDHRAGFVLSLVDGVSSLEMILDVSGMPTLDALRILYELVQQRIISFR